MKGQKKGIDLTQGMVAQQLFLFFLPILAGSILQQMYTTLDAVIIGQFAGKTGLAAIDSVYNLLKLPVNFFVGLSTGATIIISQYFGAKQEQDLSKAIHTAIAFSLVAGILLSIIGVLTAPWCLNMMQVPADIYPITLSYVRIYFAGLAVSMIYNIGTGILRAIGDSKTPFHILTISCSLNIVLDLLFVCVMRWNVAGAALSTVLAQALSAIWVIRILMNRNSVSRLVIPQIRFYGDILKSIFLIGLPLAFQSSLYPIANMMIQANINTTGTDYIASWALCGKLDFLIWLIVDSLAAAVSTFVAQNYGAKKYKRIKSGVRAGLAMTVGMIAMISVGLFFFSSVIGKLFIQSEDYGILPIVEHIMHFLAPMYVLYVFGEIFSGAIRGTGETFRPMLLTLIGTCGTRVFWMLFIVPMDKNMMSILASYPVSWLVTTVLFIIYYFFFSRKRLSSEAQYTK